MSYLIPLQVSVRLSTPLRGIIGEPWESNFLYLRFNVLFSSCAPYLVSLSQGQFCTIDSSGSRCPDHQEKITMTDSTQPPASGKSPLEETLGKIKALEQGKASNVGWFSDWTESFKD